MRSFRDWLNEQDLSEGIKVDPALARELVKAQVRALNRLLPIIARINKYTAIKAVKLDPKIKSVKKIASLGYVYVILINDEDRASVLLRTDSKTIHDYTDHSHREIKVRDNFTKYFYPTQIFGLKGEWNLSEAKVKDTSPIKTVLLPKLC